MGFRRKFKKYLIILYIKMSTKKYPKNEWDLVEIKPSSNKSKKYETSQDVRPASVEH